jgi:hypothetical protein
MADCSFAFVSYAPTQKKKVGFTIETVSAFYDFYFVASSSYQGPRESEKIGREDPPPLEKSETLLIK